MSVVSRSEVQQQINDFRLKVFHFAKGTYPVSSYDWLPYNRIFSVLENKSNVESYIGDAEHRCKLTPGEVYFTPAYYPVRMCLSEKLQFVSIQFRAEAIPGVELFANCRRFLRLDMPSFPSEADACFKQEHTLGAVITLSDLIYRVINVSLSQIKQHELTGFSVFDHYKTLINYIRNNLSADISVSDMANTMKLGREAFSRKFSAETGISPKLFLNRFLVEKACELLRNKNLSVAEVSDKLHFSSQYYFSRFFKRQTGFSPLQYRKQN